MRATDVIEVLDALDHAGVRYWVGGGWGVAALTRQETRPYRDLDLALDADQLDTGLRVLRQLGYCTETDWLPSRVELRAPRARWVDVHPVRFHPEGHGRQAGHEGPDFDYPPDAFATGWLRGRRVKCLSAQQQRRFRTGYELRPQDIHDLAQLDSLPEGRSDTPPGASPS